jgi:uncharacterized protein (DUF2267 family)
VTVRNPDILEGILHEAHHWVAETAKYVGGSPDRAHGALRAVIQALRDSLPFEEAVKFANRLPVLLRGMYYEGWNPAQPPDSDLTREKFLARVAEKLPGRIGIDPEAATAAVFRALRTLNEGKMAHLTSAWPKPLLDLPVLGTVASDGAPPLAPGAAALEKKAEEIKVAMDRAELDGAPQEELPLILDKVRNVQSSFAGAGSESGLQKLNQWLQQLMEETGWTDRHQALNIVRAVLQGLRERLPRNEALHLGRELPPALRGIYFEAWNPDLKPSEERTLEAFRSDVAERLVGVFDLSPDDAGIAVFRFLAGKISIGELVDVRRRLPKSIRDFWPEARVGLEAAKGAAARRTRIRSARGKSVMPAMSRRKLHPTRVAKSRKS